MSARAPAPTPMPPRRPPSAAPGRATAASTGTPIRRVLARQSGQATVELVALLPVLVLVALAAWQAVLVGQAVWLCGSAAREAARARAVGTDVRAAAQRVLPPRLRRNVEVRHDGDGVSVWVQVPAVLAHARLATVSSRARLEPQR